MIELRAVTYEEARMEHFVQKREEAARKIKYWGARAHKSSMMDVSQNKAADAGWEWNYYNDVIGLLGGPKEDANE